MLYIASTPHVYARLKAEIADAIKTGRISSPITNQEAQKLPYLQAVLYEGLRIMPSTTTGFSKRVPEGGDTICGAFVPAGTEVYPNLRALLLDTDVYGEDVHVFRPERWLECSAEQRALMTRPVDLLFGHGRWQCPGRTLAWMEYNKVFVEMLRNFDVQIARPERPWVLKAYSALVISDFGILLREGRLG
ncbi:cytochrome P450 [Bombardia bombarda]|uniref:Cytochrome P450 n=1 Tax=Bombardia bombarda TaxID=252184 RepID=A0AA39TKI6_9PEZI|nr:cytochrome P450 [Bombardia bombarda]